MTVLGGSVSIAIRLVRARLRGERAIVVLVALLVLVTSFTGSAAVLLFDRALDQGLRHAVTTAPPAERGLEFSQLTAIAPGADRALYEVAARGEELRAALPQSIRDLVTETTYRIESVPYQVTDAPRPITTIEFRWSSGLDGRIRLAEGRMPSATVVQRELPDRPDFNGRPTIANVYEVALSTVTADELFVSVGDELEMEPDPEAGLTGHFGSADLGVAYIRIVGMFDVLDPGSDFWLHEPHLAAPVVERVTMELSIFHGSALIHPETYRSLFTAGPFFTEGFPFVYGWRSYIDPARLQAADLDRLAADLTAVQARYPFRGLTLDAEPVLAVGLSSVVERYRGQLRTSEAALFVAALGPAGAAVGALALVAAVQARRRREATLLLRDRGASSGQVVAAQLAEALLSAVPASALGALAAVALVAGTSAGPVATLATLASIAALPAIVAVGAVAVMVAAVLPLVRAPLGTPAREPSPLRLSARRLVLDGLVVVIAIIGVVSLLGRGIAPSSGGGPAPVDPFLAAVPLVATIAVGLVVLRLYPVPVALLAALAARSRALVPALALRNAARDPAVAFAPLLVLLVATAVGGFTSAIATTVERGQDLTTWEAVGADYRIEVGASGLQREEIDALAGGGVEAVAAIYERTGRITAGDLDESELDLHAIDAIAYARVAAGTPVLPSFPQPFTAAAATGLAAGTPDDPIAAILSSAVADRAGIRTGETFMVALPGRDMWFRYVAARATFPGADPRRSWAVVPLEALEAAFPTYVRGYSGAFVRGDEAARERIRETLEPTAPDFEITSRRDLYASIHDVPLVAAVTVGLDAARLIALGYAVLALMSGLTLALASRRRQYGLLRTLGLRRGRIVGLVVLEYGPMVLTAVAVGLALGLALASTLLPALGLQTFTAGAAPPVLAIEDAELLVAALVPAAVVWIAVLAGAWLVQRSSVSRTLRIAEA